MPQSLNHKISDQPYGKGSLHAELLESSFRTRRRAAKINEGEYCRYKLYSKLLEKHHEAEEQRKSKVINRVRRTLEEMNAYKKVSNDYKVDKLKTLQWGFQPRKISTPQSFERYKLETRLYHGGYSIATLQPAVNKEIERQQPDRRKRAFHDRLLTVAKKRSDFMIDRKTTNEGMKKESKILENRLPINLLKEATFITEVTGDL